MLVFGVGLVLWIAPDRTYSHEDADRQNGEQDDEDLVGLEELHQKHADDDSRDEQACGKADLQGRTFASVRTRLRECLLPVAVCHKRHSLSFGHTGSKHTIHVKAHRREEKSKWCAALVLEPHTTSELIMHHDM